MAKYVVDVKKKTSFGGVIAFIFFLLILAALAG